MHARWTSLAALAATVLLTPPPAPAQQPDGVEAVFFDATRPISARRVVRRFDFEERPWNPTDLPTHWVRAQDDPQVPRDRPGFPIWNGGEIVYGSGAYEGDGAVRLSTRGGSASLLLDAGVIGVFPGTDYLVTGFVRTEGLVHARGRLAARFLDSAGDPIPGTERTSSLIQGVPAWVPIALEVIGNSEDAAYIQLELLLVQPAEYELVDIPDPLHVRQQDLTGSVWFDDLRVMQLPRVEVSSPEVGNLIPADREPAFDYLVRDLSGEALDIDLRLHDDLGRVVASERMTADRGREQGTWRPRVPRYGWYRASVVVSASGARIGWAFTDVAWLPGRADGLNPEVVEGVLAARGVSGLNDRRRFGVAVRELPTAAMGEIPGAIDRLGVGYASIPAWDHTTTAASIRERVDAMTPALAAITTNVPVTELSLLHVPRAVRNEADVDADDVIGLLAGRQDLWVDAMRWPLDRFGGSVSRWRVGPAGSERGYDRATLGDDLRAITDAFGRLVPSPLLVVPWAPDRALRPEAVTYRRGVVFGVDAAEGEDVARGIGARWRSAAVALDPDAVSEAPEMRIEFEGTAPSESPAIGRRARTAAFVRAALGFWAEMTRTPETEPRTPPAPDTQVVTTANWGLTVGEAFTWTGRRRPELMPAPEAAAMRVLADRLADRVFVGEPELVRGARTLLFDGPGGSVLAIWRTGTGPAELHARLGLGDLGAFDLYGNAKVIPLTTAADGGVQEHVVPVGDEPLFVEGVDAALIAFLNGVRLDPPLLQTRAGQAQHELVIENPWDTSIRGRFYILEPGGGLLPRAAMARERKSWRIVPRHAPFAISGRTEQRVPISMTFSPAEEVGPRDLVVDVDLSGEQDFGLVRVRRTIEVGLEEAQLEVTYRWAPGPAGPDLVLEARVINTGDAPLTFELFARAPGYPRGTSDVDALQPGDAATRVFPFRDAAARIIGQTIFVAAAIDETGGRLSRSIVVSGP